jgi:5-methylcytosine-specific restriction endonuclease McrA
MDVPVGEIAKAAGQSTHQFVKDLAPYCAADVQCPWCGQWSEKPICSRSALKNWPTEEVCADCKSKQQATQEERLAEYRRRQRALRSMPYRDYLQTPEWQDTRARALKRARYRCQLCYEQGQLDVHHRTYDRRGEEWSTDVIVLCRPCHSRHHEVEQ